MELNLSLSMNASRSQPKYYSVRPVVELKSLIFAVYFLVFLVGILSNGLVVYVIGRSSEVRVKSVASYYIWNLAVADLFLSLTLPLFCYSTLTSDWPFGSVTCKASYALRESNKFVGVLLLVALSVDRYAATFYNLGLLRTIQVGKRVCVLSWASALVLTAPYWLYAGTVSTDDGPSALHSCRLFWKFAAMRAWILFQFFVGFVAPLAAIFLCYLGLWLRLRKLQGGGRSRATAIKRPGRTMTRMTLIAAVTFLFTHLPYYVMELVNGAKGEALQSSPGSSAADAMDSVPSHEKRLFVALTFASKLLVYMSSCCNPLIYGFLNKNYRKLFVDSLRRLSSMTSDLRSRLRRSPDRS